MNVKIESFEKRVADAVSELRNLIGAEQVEVNAVVDGYETKCRVNITFYSSIPTDASGVPSISD